MKKPATKAAKPIDPLASAITEIQPRKKPLGAFELNDKLAPNLERRRDLKHQVKEITLMVEHLETDIKAACLTEFSRRAFKGDAANLDVIGGEADAKFVVKNSGRKMDQSDKAKFAKDWGKEAANCLIVENTKDIKLDYTIWESNRDLFLQALNATDKNGQRIIPAEVVKSFLTASLRISETAVADAKNFAKSAAELQQIYVDLKITTALS